jgi:hypothetical protein
LVQVKKNFQEPRFLLPLVAPAIATCDPSRVSKGMWAAHVAYHVGMSAFFGVFHQGGVVWSVLALNHIPSSSHIVYWKTYPPPLHLLQVNHTIVDLQGKNFVCCWIVVFDKSSRIGIARFYVECNSRLFGGSFERCKIDTWSANS